MNLQALRIPPRLRGDYRELPAAQVFDLQIEGTRVRRMRPGSGAARGTLISAMVDAHVHLDKSYTEGEVGAACGDLRAAIARSGAHRARWRADDLRARMERALADAWSHGTRAMRTHLDWVEAEPPLALSVFEELRALWRGRVELQLCALLPLDLWLDADRARAVAGRVAACARHGTCALGAFVYRNDALHAKLDRLFAVAAEFGLPLDFHVDEGLEPQANGLRCLDKIKVSASASIKDGDIAAINGHVVMIDDVGPDPFGLNKITKIEDCNTAHLPYSAFDFVITQSSPSRSGIGVNRFQARDYFKESGTYRDGLTRYAIAACKAKFGTISTVDTTSLSVVRHKKTPECKAPALTANREECVDSCQPL